MNRFLDKVSVPTAQAWHPLTAADVGHRDHPGTRRLSTYPLGRCPLLWSWFDRVRGDGQADQTGNQTRETSSREKSFLWHAEYTLLQLHILRCICDSCQSLPSGSSASAPCRYLCPSCDGPLGQSHCVLPCLAWISYLAPGCCGDCVGRRFCQCVVQVVDRGCRRCEDPWGYAGRLVRRLVKGKLVALDTSKDPWVEDADIGRNDDV